MFQETSARVLAYGRFDVFSPSDAAFLRFASAQGNSLSVGLVTPDLHGVSATQQTFATRAAMLQACRYVDHVFPFASLEQVRTDIINYDAAILVLGDGLPPIWQDLSDVVRVVPYTQSWAGAHNLHKLSA